MYVLVLPNMNRELEETTKASLLGYMPLFSEGAAARFFLIFPQNEAYDHTSLTGFFLFYLLQLDSKSKVRVLSVPILPRSARIPVWQQN